MRAGALIWAVALAACTFSLSPAGALARIDDSCSGGALQRVRSLIEDSERYPATSYANAFARYHDLNDYVQTSAEFVRTIAAQVATDCGQRGEARLDVYGEWAGVLRDQADDVFLRKEAPCGEWTLAVIRFQIASHAPVLATLVRRLGMRDPDVRHVHRLLMDWAAQYRMNLPPATSSAQAAQFLASYARSYDRAASRVPKGC